MSISSNSRILVTGATGSFGKAFIARLLNRFPDIKRIVIYSRDELKQWELQQQYPESQYPQLRFFLGDVRDQERLRRALETVDTVVHAAALKQVPAAEYNPMEFVKTNVLGAENLIQAVWIPLLSVLLHLVLIRLQLRLISMEQQSFVPTNCLSRRTTLRAAAISVFCRALRQCDGIARFRNSFFPKQSPLWFSPDH